MYSYYYCYYPRTTPTATTTLPRLRRTTLTMTPRTTTLYPKPYTKTPTSTTVLYYNSYCH